MDKVIFLIIVLTYFFLKILEEERLGLTCPQAQQHTRFDAPQQQSFNSSGGVRPFFRPTRFQVPFQNQSMQSGGSSFNQLQTPQTPHLTTPVFIYFLFLK